MFFTLFKWLTSGPLDRILTTVDRKMDNATERERVKAKAVETYIDAQTRVLTGRGWWFPLFFIAPLGVWFASVCIYSILFCAGCAYPQGWSIAALPTPLNEWAGVIIGSLFLAKSGEALIARFKK
jgi:hypothetical protein